MANRLNVSQLNALLIHDLGDQFIVKSDPARKPLLFTPKNNPDVTFKAYVYNCTNPPGGRTLDEYKIQLILPDQKRGERGFLDESDGSFILIIGYAIYDANDNGVWVIWETSRHRDFAYSANLQVKMGSLIETITKKVYSIKKPGNGEYILVSDRNSLNEAIALRQKIDVEKMLEE